MLLKKRVRLVSNKVEKLCRRVYIDLEEAIILFFILNLYLSENYQRIGIIFMLRLFYVDFMFMNIYLHFL